MAHEFASCRKWSVIAVAAAATLFATTVSAESIRLVRGSQAESIASGGVSMTVYYLDQSNPIEVVATFGERGSAKPASQLRMSLTDGEDIAFVVPGRPDVSFRFMRTGSLVEVRADPDAAGATPTN